MHSTVGDPTEDPTADDDVTASAWTAEKTVLTSQALPLKSSTAHSWVMIRGQSVAARRYTRP